MDRKGLRLVVTDRLRERRRRRRVVRQVDGYELAAGALELLAAEGCPWCGSSPCDPFCVPPPMGR